MAFSAKTMLGKLNSVSYDGAWYTEDSDTTFVTISQILMKWDEFIISHGYIWQTLAMLARVCKLIHRLRYMHCWCRNFLCYLIFYTTGSKTKHDSNTRNSCHCLICQNSSKATIGKWLFSVLFHMGRKFLPDFIYWASTSCIVCSLQENLTLHWESEESESFWEWTDNSMRCVVAMEMYRTCSSFASLESGQ